MSIITEITAILKDVPLGASRIRGGLILRESKYLNSVLYSSESWHSLSIQDILGIERQDLHLLRLILYKAHSKTPVEFIHLETSTTTIRFMISARRVNYLHNILNRDKNNILLNYYQAQEKQNYPGDYFRLVQNDKTILNINLSYQEIKNWDFIKFKELLRNKAFLSSRRYMLDLQKTHNKVKTISYECNDIQEYLISPLIRNYERKLLFQLRSRMYPGIKENFQSFYKDDLSCPLSCDSTHADTQENLLICSKLTQNLSIEDIHYSDLFDNIHLQSNTVKILSSMLKKREKISLQNQENKKI